MKLHPFWESAAKAKALMDQGLTVYQQFNCAHCGTKQTIDTPNRFHTSGICEECDSLTDIEQNGCNFQVHAVMGRAHG